METFDTRLRKSSKEWSEQSARLFRETKEIGKQFADFVQHEARDWTDYLLERSRQIGAQGWGLLDPKVLFSRLRPRDGKGENAEAKEEGGEAGTEQVEAKPAEAEQAEAEQAETEQAEAESRGEPEADTAEGEDDQEKASDEEE